MFGVPTSLLKLSVLVLPVILSILLAPLQSNVDIIYPRTLDRGRHHAPRFLLLTAHPDDECMFFAPTLLGLLQAYDKPEVYSLCLSLGDADGLGDVRRSEFHRSLDVLGVPEGRRWALDTPDLQDNFTARWDSGIVADTILPYVLEHQITTILTFDHNGISSHPNHISLLFGAAELIVSLSSSSDTYADAPRLFSLVTTSLMNKYTGPFAPVLARLQVLTAPFLDFFALDSRVGKNTRSAVFVSGLAQYKTALRAMMQHRSQLVWFRWLYVTFSRYMWTNEWVEITPSSADAVFIMRSRRDACRPW